MKEKSLNKKKIIAIVGPTASGKSRLAIRIAKKNNGEIISADSRQIYKGFDIATAKPSIEEMEGIEHYLIDIVEPEIDYSVANFYNDAKAAIEKIYSKGKIPIVVGGTGLYFRILLENFSPPKVAPDYELRAELEKLESKKLHKMLEKLDLQSAQKIHFNNKVKIIRAIEVSLTLQSPHSKAAGKKEPEFEVEWIGLNPSNRADLYKRIDLRVDEMIKKGLVEETKALLKKHGRINNFINTIGYQEILEYLDGKISLNEAILLIKQNSRHYAKRQLTWFRKNKLINWQEA
ncbi:MAG TPA: tRNA (adenosine(37)-N6)-dimethylallyltransferase MiaA [Candidatus Gastranaerophilaceae bacterium]|nr:tRNA (adenosine(37)-N6)-dimethylallyltransferase MiaA [Candidatus Gastranaerophilaceae bacterium]HPT41601.1 tRNA (adenosine(37)-N6)-dimethylallyltransferase MiaA [Candidatus Gastranaerophilaceae bacterium]